MASRMECGQDIDDQVFRSEMADVDESDARLLGISGRVIPQIPAHIYLSARSDGRSHQAGAAPRAHGDRLHHQVRLADHLYRRKIQFGFQPAGQKASNGIGDNSLPTRPKPARWSLTESGYTS